MSTPSLTILFEHPEWQKPLFAALERRQIPFTTLDLKAGAFAPNELPIEPLYFNQASPSAYVRGNARAVPFALACMRHLESRGARVLNGSQAFSLELSKSAQLDLLTRMGVDHPRSLVFNDLSAVRRAARDWSWPCLLKPDQGGSGARMFLLESFEELERLLHLQPEVWLPDNLLLLQEYFPRDPTRGIVRMEFVGGELLYAMRVIAHDGFNLCPSELCNPSDPNAASVCEVPEKKPSRPVEFIAYPDVPASAVEIGERIVREGKLDVGGIEYLETADGRHVFFDINANSNLRPAVAKEFGFDPFERVVDFLASKLAA